MSLDSRVTTNAAISVSINGTRISVAAIEESSHSSASLNQHMDIVELKSW